MRADKWLEAHGVPDTLSEEQFAYLTGRISWKPVLGLATTAVLFLSASLLTGFSKSRILVILGALLSPPILFLYSRLTLRKRRGVFPMLVGFSGLIPYVLGCYLVFFEGLWGIVGTFRVFALSSLLWSLGCCTLGLVIVYGMYPLTELCRAMDKGLITVNQGTGGHQGDPT